MYQVQLAFRYTHTLCISRAGWWSIVYVVCIYWKISIAFPPRSKSSSDSLYKYTYIYSIYILYPKGPSRLLFSSQKTHTHTLVLLSVYVHKLKYRSITTYTSRRKKREKRLTVAKMFVKVRQGLNKKERQVFFVSFYQLRLLKNFHDLSENKENDNSQPKRWESKRETDRHRDRERRRRRYANKMLPLRVYGLTSSKKKKKKTMQVEGFEETRKNFLCSPFLSGPPFFRSSKMNVVLSNSLEYLNDLEL